MHDLLSFLWSLASWRNRKAIKMRRINGEVLLYQHVPSSYSLHKFSLLLGLSLWPLLRMVPARLLKLLLLWLSLPLLPHLIGQPTGTRIPAEPMLWKLMFLLVLR